MARRVVKTGSDKPSFITDKTFASMGVCAASLRGLTETLGYTYMTEVQAASIPVIARGSDVLAKARTGTGKTLGFLVPAVEALTKLRDQPRVGEISVLIVSPTRELAMQTDREARALLTHHAYRSLTVIGGTNMSAEQKKLRQRTDVLIATPGRLIDHFENTPGFMEQVSHLKVLIMDEADQLLDMGFKPAIDKILGYVPAKRQTLLFSATVPDSVHKVAKRAMPSGHEFINTVPESETNTHHHVDQEYVVAPLADQLATVARVILHNRRKAGHKIMCFWPTARMTQYMAEVFCAAGIPVLDIHSRKSQAARLKASRQFLDSENVTMFTSDVSARGMDYPGLTLVMQVGITDKEAYVHRLGRTARAGLDGAGVLILAPHERHMLKLLSHLPLKEAGRDSTITGGDAVLGRAPGDVSDLAPLYRVIRDVESGRGALADRVAQAYSSWLGFYNGQLRACRWTPEQLVAETNAFFATLGAPEPPRLQKRTVGKMGLKGVRGLNVY